MPQTVGWAKRSRCFVQGLWRALWFLPVQEWNLDLYQAIPQAKPSIKPIKEKEKSTTEVCRGTTHHNMHTSFSVLIIVFFCLCVGWWYSRCCNQLTTCIICPFPDLIANRDDCKIYKLNFKRKFVLTGMRWLDNRWPWVNKIKGITWREILSLSSSHHIETIILIAHQPSVSEIFRLKS